MRASSSHVARKILVYARRNTGTLVAVANLQRRTDNIEWFSHAEHAVQSGNTSQLALELAATEDRVALGIGRAV